MNRLAIIAAALALMAPHTARAQPLDHEQCRELLFDEMQEGLASAGGDIAGRRDFPLGVFVAPEDSDIKLIKVTQSVRDGCAALTIDFVIPEDDDVDVGAMRGITSVVESVMPGLEQSSLDIATAVTFCMKARPRTYNKGMTVRTGRGESGPLTLYCSTQATASHGSETHVFFRLDLPQAG